jgi:hypothetical protein
MKRCAIAILAAAASMFSTSLCHADVENFVQGESNDLVGDYTGTTDASVYANTNAPNYNYNYGGANKLISRNSSSRYRFIMDFNLSALTGLGITVQSATLVLTKYAATITTTDTSLYTYSVSSIAATNAGWNQGTDTGASVQAGEVTGEYWAAPDPSGTPAGVLWQTSTGAQSPQTSGVAGAGVTTSMFTSQGYTYNADPNGTTYALSDPSLTALVQTWITNPSQNAGLFFSNGGSSIEVEFASSEYATPSWRPDLQLTVSSPTMGTDWITDANGSWSTNGNWDNTAPNSVGATANFGTTISAALTINVDAPQIVSSLNFSSPYGYTLAGSNAISLIEVNVGQATINVTAGNQLISAPVNMVTNTTITVASGSSLTINGALSATGKTITNAGSGYTALPAISADTLDVNAGTVAINQHAGTSTLNTLSIASGATLDLKDNALDINYTTSSPLPTVLGYLQAGYNNGLWNGAGLGSSLAATHPGTGVGYVDTGTQVQVMYTWYGDLDLSGTVDSTDQGLMGVIPSTGAEAGLIGWFDGDLNYDGVINSDDWALFDLGLAESGGASISSVPEPTALCLAMVGGVMLIRRSTALSKIKRRH